MDSMQKRNIGIDLLRIVSMVMVVVLHVLGRGGILYSTAFLSTNYNIAWFLEIAAFCAVNCYALISGFVGIHSNHKASGLMTLWLQVAFYSVLISIVMYFTHGVIEISDILKAFFPVSLTKYWYFTAYFAMWFFVPLMNTAINHMSKKQTAIALLSIGILLIPIELLTKAFDMNGGYGVLWLCYLYLIGAYIGKYELFVGVSCKKSFLAYFACIAITFLHKIVANIFWGPGDFFINYMSPFMLIAAISLLILFINLQIPTKLTKMITLIGSLSFSVYLIHTHPLIFTHILTDRFSFLVAANPFMLIAIVFLATAGIFIVCALIDYLRLCLFKALKIRQFFAWIETRITIYLEKGLQKFFSIKE